MMHKSYVLARIDTLRGREDLTTILQLTGEDPKHKDKGAEPADPEPGSSKRKAGTSASSSKAQKSAEDLEDMSFTSIEKKGTMPKKKKASFAGGAQAAAVYGLRDWAEFTLLQEYLYINGKVPTEICAQRWELHVEGNPGGHQLSCRVPRQSYFKGRWYCLWWITLISSFLY